MSEVKGGAPSTDEEKSLFMVCMGVRAGNIHKMPRNQTAAGGGRIYVILPATLNELPYALIYSWHRRELNEALKI